MLDLLKNGIRRSAFLYRVSTRIYGATVVRFTDRRRYTRYRLTRVLHALAQLTVGEHLVGGVMTDEGDYYLHLSDGLFVYYNFDYPEYTLGDGQSLEFKPEPKFDHIEELLREHLSNDSVYFDVGANNGCFYCLKVAKTYPRCRIHGFEPDARVLGLLRKNVAFNRATNVVVAPIALADHDGAGKMTANMGASGYLMQESASGTGLVSVEVSTLDRYVREHGLDRLDVIKVDIEGGELAFFRGAQETFKLFRPLIVTELREELLSRSNASTAGLRTLLSELGYIGFRPQGGEDAVFVPHERLAAFRAVPRDWLQPL